MTGELLDYDFDFRGFAEMLGRIRFDRRHFTPPISHAFLCAPDSLRLPMPLGRHQTRALRLLQYRHLHLRDDELSLIMLARMYIDQDGAELTTSELPRRSLSRTPSGDFIEAECSIMMEARSHRKVSAPTPTSLWRRQAYAL